MRTNKYENLKQLMMPMETVNLVAKINEYKGKQEQGRGFSVFQELVEGLLTINLLLKGL